jgi:hypothetical protein
MKTVAAILTLLMTGVLSVVSADPAAPATPASPAPAAQSSPAENSNDQSSAKPVSAPAATAENPAATAAKPVASSAPKERAEEQLLRNQGYKPTMVNGEEMYCRREAPLGSRLGSTVHCVTVQEAELIAKEGREVTERIQRTTPGCLGPSMGGCGK